MPSSVAGRAGLISYSSEGLTCSSHYSVLGIWPWSVTSDGETRVAPTETRTSSSGAAMSSNERTSVLLSVTGPSRVALSWR